MIISDKVNEALIREIKLNSIISDEPMDFILIDYNSILVKDFHNSESKVNEILKDVSGYKIINSINVICNWIIK